MNRFARAILIATTLALPLAGCESVNGFDPTEWIPSDPFGTKKKLTGERKPVFPEGVPGMARGVPPELIRGQQPGSDVAQDLQPPQRAAIEEQPKPKAEPKARPKAKAAPRPETAAAPSTPTPVTVRRSDAPSPFPDPPPTGQQPPPAAAPWPGEERGQGGGVQWPDPPPPSRPSR